MLTVSLKGTLRAFEGKTGHENYLAFKHHQQV
jgi:hypothetical protein